MRWSLGSLRFGVIFCRLLVGCVVWLVWVVILLFVLVSLMCLAVVSWFAVGVFKLVVRFWCCFWCCFGLFVVVLLRVDYCFGGLWCLCV